MKEPTYRPEPSVPALNAALAAYHWTAARREAAMNREGFYPYRDDSKLPFPLAREKAWKGEREFREALVALEGRRQVTRIANDGRDECLFCETKLPRTEFWVLGQWKWTSAFFHYVKEHHVRPGLGFYEFVLGHELS